MRDAPKLHVNPKVFILLCGDVKQLYDATIFWRKTDPIYGPAGYFKEQEPSKNMLVSNNSYHKNLIKVLKKV